MYICSASDVYLRKAFLKIAQKLPIMNEWRRLAMGLGLHDDVINKIDGDHPGIRDKVTTCLTTWLDRTGEEANIKQLMNLLKRCSWSSIAGQSLLDFFWYSYSYVFVLIFVFVSIMADHLDHIYAYCQPYHAIFDMSIMISDIITFTYGASRWDTQNKWDHVSF